jgi:hypothetical protein
MNYLENLTEFKNKYYEFHSTSRDRFLDYFMYQFVESMCSKLTKTHMFKFE